MTRRLLYAYFFLLASVVLGILATLPLLDKRLHLVFCDVGQGDGILIYRGSRQILIDAGPNNKIQTCLSRHMPFWDRRIELLVLTNPDLDHYFGFIDIVKNYQTSTFVSPGIEKTDAAFNELGGLLHTKHIKVVNINSSNTLQLGEIKLQTLWPSPSSLAFLEESGNVLGLKTARPEEINENSLVIDLTYGSFQALLTGDIVPPSSDVVAEFIARRIDSANTGIEVLKVPHHGSKNGLTQLMIDAVRPKLAIISVGKNNRYGHPSSETLKLLEGIKTLRTDIEGEIEVVTDGEGWWIR